MVILYAEQKITSLCTVIFALCHFGTDLIGGNRLAIKIGKAPTYPKSPPTINFNLADLLNKKKHVQHIW